MSAIPYMPLYIADYLADAAHLTTIEHGAYMLLIMNYWQRGKPLDNSNGRLANVARTSNEEWTKIEPVLREFFEIDGDQWTHKRIERELEHFRSKSDKAKAAGKASAQRRSNGRSTDVQRTLNHTDTDTDTDKNTPVHSEQVAAREDGRTDTPAELKSAFNGSTEAMLAFVELAMGPNSRANAIAWLTATTSAHGSVAVAQAFASLAEKRAAGEVITRPLPLWSSIAAGMRSSGGRRAPPEKPRKRSVMDVIRENPMPEVVQ